jgi:site-specific recombinase XerD
MSGWRVQHREGGLMVVDGTGAEDPACAAFLDRLLVRGLSLDTIDAYAYDLVLVRRWLDAEKLRLEEVNGDRLHRFLAWERARASSPKSINRRLHTLRLFFRHLTGHEVPGSAIDVRPVRTHRDRELGLQTIRTTGRRQLRVQEPRRVVEPLSIEQVNELLRGLRRYRDIGIAYLMLLCGLRSQEVLKLLLTDIDREDRRLRIRGKGGKERSVPAPPLLLDVLRKYAALERPVTGAPNVFVVLQGTHRGKPMTRAGLRRVFRTRRLRPKLANANPHRLRHTFGTDMARSGVRLPILQRMMGHAYTETTLQYVNVSMADVATEFLRALEKVEHRYELEGGAR